MYQYYMTSQLNPTQRRSITCGEVFETCKLIILRGTKYTRKLLITPANKRIYRVKLLTGK